MTETPCIEAKGLAFAYGDRRALTGVDLTVGPVRISGRGIVAT